MSVCYIFRYLNAQGQISLTTAAQCAGDDVAIRSAILGMDRRCCAVEVMREDGGGTIWTGTSEEAVEKLSEALRPRPRALR